MSYLPEGTPLPNPGPDDRPYWEFCAKQELRIQCCTNCCRFRHPPAPFCASCGSGEMEWKQVSGNGSVFSYTVAHYATHPALKSALPYNIVVVMLDDADDVRIISNVVDVEPSEMKIGMPVRLVWEPLADGGCAPRFRRAGA
jgi:uncharacterized OB-fold protein